MKSFIAISPHPPEGTVVIKQVNQPAPSPRNVKLLHLLINFNKGEGLFAGSNSRGQTFSLINNLIKLKKLAFLGEGGRLSCSTVLDSLFCRMRAHV